jgi:hypothetical protein
MKRVVAMVTGGVALLGALVWGCAASHQTAFNEPRDWKTYEPDGGWENYVPPSRIYQPDPARTNRLGTPIPGPLGPDTGGLPSQTLPTLP